MSTVSGNQKAFPMCWVSFFPLFFFNPLTPILNFQSCRLFIFLSKYFSGKDKLESCSLPLEIMTKRKGTH